MKRILIYIFIAAAVTAIAIRSTGYTSASQEGGKYFAHYRSMRNEISRQEFEDIQFRHRWSTTAILIMAGAILGVILIDRIWISRRR